MDMQQKRLEDFIQRADQLIAQAGKVLATEPASGGYRYVKDEPFRAFRSASLSSLAAIFGKEHAYYTEFDSQAKSTSPSDTGQGRGVLLAAREEMAGGWLNTRKGLVSAEIFADFLEMAEHLLDEGYKDPAAVVAGSVLEEHLRQLCQKKGIGIEVSQQQGRQVHKKADTLNAELAKAGVYNKLDQKNVIAWWGLRNNAAHGKYQEYTKEQVALMLPGI